MTEAFFEQETQDRFVPTGHTQEPWEPGFQHGARPPRFWAGNAFPSLVWRL